jgi:TP901 family phage tail tape measure protein
VALSVGEIEATLKLRDEMTAKLTAAAHKVQGSFKEMSREAVLSVREVSEALSRAQAPIKPTRVASPITAQWLQSELAATASMQSAWELLRKQQAQSIYHMRDALRSLSDAMKVPAIQTRSLADVAVVLGRAFHTSIGDIIGISGHLAKAGSQAGLTAHELMALSAAAISTELGIFRSRKALDALLVSTARAGKDGVASLLAFAQALGMTEGEFQKLASGGAGAVQAVLEALNRIKEQGGDAAQALAAVGIQSGRVFNRTLSDDVLRIAASELRVADATDVARRAWGLHSNVAAENLVVVDRLSTGLERITKSTDSTAQGTSRLSRALGKEFTTTVREASKEGNKFAEGFLQALMPLPPAETTVSQNARMIAQSLETASGHAQGFGEQVKQIGEEADQTAQSLAGMAKSIYSSINYVINLPSRVAAVVIRPISDLVTRLGTAMTVGITVPLTGFAVASARAAISFESAFAGVAKTVDGVKDSLGRLTGAGEALRSQLRVMATREIPMTVEELSQIAEIGGQLGIALQGIESFTRTVAMLATATNLGLEGSATAIAKVSTIMGIAAKDYQRLGSVIALLGDRAASTEVDIADMTIRLASTAKVVGLSASNVVAFATALSDIGIEAESGGTAFSKVFQSIYESVKTSNAELRTFAETAGMSAEEFKNAFGRDPAAAIAAFVNGLRKIHHEGGNVFAVLRDVEFQDARLKRAITGVAASEDKLTGYLRMANREWADNTYLAQEAGVRWATTASMLKRLWSQVKDLGITIGDALTPGIQLAVRAMELLLRVADAVAKLFALLPGPIQLVIFGVIALAAAIGPLLIALLHLVSVFAVLFTFAQVNRIFNLVAVGMSGAAAGAGSAITAMRPFGAMLTEMLMGMGKFGVVLLATGRGVGRFAAAMAQSVREMFSVRTAISAFGDAIAGTFELVGKGLIVVARLIGGPRLLAVALLALAASLPAVREAFGALLKILGSIYDIAVRHVVAAFDLMGRAMAVWGERLRQAWEWVSANVPGFSLLATVAGKVADAAKWLAGVLDDLNQSGAVSQTVVTALAVAMMVLTARGLLSGIAGLVRAFVTLNSGFSGTIRWLFGLSTAIRTVSREQSALGAVLRQVGRFWTGVTNAVGRGLGVLRSLMGLRVERVGESLGVGFIGVGTSVDWAASRLRAFWSVLKGSAPITMLLGNMHKLSALMMTLSIQGVEMTAMQLVAGRLTHAFDLIRTAWRAMVSALASSTAFEVLAAGMRRLVAVGALLRTGWQTMMAAMSASVFGRAAAAMIKVTVAALEVADALVKGDLAAAAVAASMGRVRGVAIVLAASFGTAVAALYLYSIQTATMIGTMGTAVLLMGIHAVAAAVLRSRMILMVGAAEAVSAVFVALTQIVIGWVAVLKMAIVLLRAMFIELLAFARSMGLVRVAQELLRLGTQALIVLWRGFAALSRGVVVALDTTQVGMRLTAAATSVLVRAFDAVLTVAARWMTAMNGAARYVVAAMISAEIAIKKALVSILVWLVKVVDSSNAFQLIGGRFTFVGRAMMILRSAMIGMAEGFQTLYGGLNRARTVFATIASSLLLMRERLNPNALVAYSAEFAAFQQTMVRSGTSTNIFVSSIQRVIATLSLLGTAFLRVTGLQRLMFMPTWKGSRAQELVAELGPTLRYLQGMIKEFGALKVTGWLFGTTQLFNKNAASALVLFNAQFAALQRNATATGTLIMRLQTGFALIPRSVSVATTAMVTFISSIARFRAILVDVAVTTFARALAGLRTILSALPMAGLIAKVLGMQAAMEIASLGMQKAAALLSFFGKTELAVALTSEALQFRLMRLSAIQGVLATLGAGFQNLRNAGGLVGAMIARMGEAILQAGRAFIACTFNVKSLEVTLAAWAGRLLPIMGTAIRGITGAFTNFGAVMRGMVGTMAAAFVTASRAAGAFAVAILGALRSLNAVLLESMTAALIRLSSAALLVGNVWRGMTAAISLATLQAVANNVKVFVIQLWQMAAGSKAGLVSVAAFGRGLAGLRASLIFAWQGLKNLSAAFVLVMLRGRETATAMLKAQAAISMVGGTAVVGGMSRLGVMLGGMVTGLAAFLAKWVIIPGVLAEVVRMIYLTATGTGTLSDNFEDWARTLSLSNNAIAATLEFLGLYERESTRAARKTKEFEDEVQRLVDEFSGKTMTEEAEKIHQAFNQLAGDGKILGPPLEEIRRRLVALQQQAKERGFDFYQMFPWAKDILSGNIESVLTQQIDRIRAKVEQLQNPPQPSATQRGWLSQFTGKLPASPTIDTGGLQKQAAILEETIKELRRTGSKVSLPDDLRTLLFGYGIDTGALEKAAAADAKAFLELSRAAEQTSGIGRAVSAVFGSEFARRIGLIDTQFQKFGATQEDVNRATTKLAKALYDLEQQTGGLPPWAKALLESSGDLAAALDLIWNAAVGPKIPPAAFDPAIYAKQLKRAHEIAASLGGENLKNVRGFVTSNVSDDQAVGQFARAMEAALKLPQSEDLQVWKDVFDIVKSGMDKSGEAAEKFVQKLSGKEAVTRLKEMVRQFSQVGVGGLGVAEMDAFLKSAKEIEDRVGDLGTTVGHKAVQMREDILKNIGKATWSQALSDAELAIQETTAQWKNVPIELISSAAIKDYLDKIADLEQITGHGIDWNVKAVEAGAVQMKAQFLAAVPGAEWADRMKALAQAGVTPLSPLKQLQEQMKTLDNEMTAAGAIGAMTASQFMDFGQRAAETAARMFELNGSVSDSTMAMALLFLKVQGVDESWLHMAGGAAAFTARLTTMRSALSDNAAAIAQLDTEVETLRRPIRVDMVTTRIDDARFAFEQLQKQIVAVGRDAPNTQERIDKEFKKLGLTVAKLTEEWIRGGEATKTELNQLAALATTRYRLMAESGRFSAEAVRRAWDEMTAANVLSLGKWATYAQEIGNSIAESLAGGLASMLDGTKSFAEAFMGIWEGIGAAVSNVFKQIVQDFIQKLILNLLNKIATSKIGEALTGALSKIGGGGAAAGAGGSATTGLSTFASAAIANVQQRVSGYGNVLQSTPLPTNYTLPPTATSWMGGGGGTIPSFGSSSAGGVEGAGSNLPSQLGGVALGAGSIVGAYKSGQSGDAMGVLGSIAGGAAAGFMIGGPIGAIVGAAAAGIAALVGHFKKPVWKKVMEEVGRDWGKRLGDGMKVEISEELAKKIEADVKKVGNRQFAIVMNVGAILAEQGGGDLLKGIKLYGVEQSIAKVRDLFVGLRMQILNVTQVTEEMEEVFPALAEAATDANGLISASFKELISLAHESGLEIAAMTEWVNTQSERLAGGIAKMMAAFSKNVGDAFRAAFKGAVEAVGGLEGTVEEALAKLWDALGTADANQVWDEMFGGGGEAAGRSVEAIQTELEAARTSFTTLGEQIDELNGKLAEMQSAGGYTAHDFGVMADQIERARAQMEAIGATITALEAELARAGQTSTGGGGGGATPMTQPMIELQAALETAKGRAASAREEFVRLSDALLYMERTGGFTKAQIKAIGDQLQVAKQRLTEAEQAVVDLQDEFNQVGQGRTMGEITRDLVIAQLVVKKASRAVDELTRTLDTMRQSGGFTADQIGRVEEQLRLATSALAEAQQRVSDLEEEWRRTTGGVVSMEKLREVVEKVQPEFDRLSRIAAMSFAAMLREGKSPVEAIRAIGESLDQLIAIYDKLSGAGLKAGPAFEVLKRYRTLVKDNEALIDSIGGINDALVVLQNFDALTPELFSDLTGQALLTFENLQNAGFTAGESLQMMAPLLMTIKKLHEETGFAIDDETQKLIDAAEAQGLLKGEGMSTNQILIEGLRAIILALGGTLPEAFKTFADKAETETRRIRDGIDKIPRYIDVALNYTEGDVPSGPGGGAGGMGRAGGAAAGGMVTTAGRLLQFTQGGRVPVLGATGARYLAEGSAAARVIPFVPRGTDTVPAMLTPGEIVLNAAQQRAVASAIRTRGDASAPITITIISTLDGREVARNQVKYLPERLKVAGY